MLVWLVWLALLQFVALECLGLLDGGRPAQQSLSPCIREYSCRVACSLNPLFPGLSLDVGRARDPRMQILFANNSRVGVEIGNLPQPQLDV